VALQGHMSNTQVLDKKIYVLVPPTTSRSLGIEFFCTCTYKYVCVCVGVYPSLQSKL
jgi:hypothetical protein